MPAIVIAADSDWVHEQVEAALAGPDVTLRRVRRGVDVLPAVLDSPPDVVVLDLQIGNMGGMATAMDLRLEEGMGRIDPVGVVMLLDRDADIFLARRSDADGFLVKPVNPIALRELVEGVAADLEARRAGLGAEESAHADDPADLDAVGAEALDAGPSPA